MMSLIRDKDSFLMESCFEKKQGLMQMEHNALAPTTYTKIVGRFYSSDMLLDETTLRFLRVADTKKYIKPKFLL